MHEVISILKNVFGEGGGRKGVNSNFKEKCHLRKNSLLFAEHGWRARGLIQPQMNGGKKKTMGRMWFSSLRKVSLLLLFIIIIIIIIIIWKGLFHSVIIECRENDNIWKL